MTETRQVALLTGRSGHDDVVAVTVVEGAIRHRDAIVTSNRQHIEQVAQSADVMIRIADT